MRAGGAGRDGGWRKEVWGVPGGRPHVCQGGCCWRCGCCGESAGDALGGGAGAGVLGCLVVPLRAGTWRVPSPLSPRMLSGWWGHRGHPGTQHPVHPPATVPPLHVLVGGCLGPPMSREAHRTSGHGWACRHLPLCWRGAPGAPSLRGSWPGPCPADGATSLLQSPAAKPFQALKGSCAPQDPSQEGPHTLPGTAPGSPPALSPRGAPGGLVGPR